jgi:hypothetical protein
MTFTNFACSMVWLTILMSFGTGSLSVLLGQPITGTVIGAVKDGTCALIPNRTVLIDKDTSCGVPSSADNTRPYTAPLPLDTCGEAIRNIAETDPLNPNPPAVKLVFAWPVDLTFLGFSDLLQIDIEIPAAAQNSSLQSFLPPTPNKEDRSYPGPDQPAENKRMFGVLPNYRMAEGSAPFQPITTKQKFIIATKDSFDYPVFLTTAFFAGLSQLQGSDNSLYRQGVRGFTYRYGFSYADQLMSNFFPEAIVPALFHKDPRYYRKGEGSKGSRLVYAIGRIFVSKSDSGATTFNSPEILGNGLAALGGMTYHTQGRTAGDVLTQWGITYIGTDTVGQVLKEFWPDIKRKLFK